MSSRLRVALGLACLVAGPALARAQVTPAEQAAKLNDEGKQLFAAKDYDAAYQKFSQATVLSPEGRFFFNECFTLNFLERYQEAIDACEQVEANGADAKLIEKAHNAVAALRQKLAAQQGSNGGNPTGGNPTGGNPTGGNPTGGNPTGGNPDGGNPTGGNPTGGNPDGGNPTGGNPTGGNPDGGNPTGGNPTGGNPTGGNPTGPIAPANDPFAVQSAPAIEDDYKWSIGGELGFLGNGGMGKRGNLENYSSSGINLRLFANFMVSAARKLGLQAYLQISNLDAGANTFDMQRLNVVDLGGAGFLTRKLTSKLYWSPLLGAHLSVQQPANLSEGFIAVGLRAEVQFAYVFGPKSENALTFTPGLNIYGAASGTAGGFAPADFNLDHGSATVTFGVGYQYRFSTPFGSTPIISLE